MRTLLVHAMRTLSFAVLAVLPAALLCVAGVAFAQEGAGEEEAYDDPQTYGLREAARDRRAITLGSGEGGARPSVVPDSHRVVRGDTLWDLCEYYYNNPYQWPRVWSFNPEVTNPHWIYPGFSMRLRRGGMQPAQQGGIERVGPVGRGAPDTVFLRDRGFLDTAQYGSAGTVVGSPEEAMLLTIYDEVYVEFEDPSVVRIGQEYSVFQRVRGVPSEGGGDSGIIVEFMGSIRVDTYDAERKLARGVITEALNPIERGQRVAPIERRFDVVAPLRNDRDLLGRVMAAMDPREVLGEHHLVFVDKGANDGVRPGNRFFVVRQRDEFRRSLDEPDDRSGYPYEVIAELRVVEARETTSTCLVVRSTREVDVGDRVEMRVGY